MNLRDSGTGWISPDGSEVGCNSFMHLEEVVQNSILKKYYPEIDDDLISLKETERECENLAASGEHPEWHVYEIHEDRIRYNVLNRLYESGFIRIGVARFNGRIEAEGTSASINSKMHILVRFVEAYNDEHGTDYRLNAVIRRTQA